MLRDTRNLDLLTERELAPIIKRSTATLTRWRRTRCGPPWIQVNGRVLYDRNAVEAWLRAQSIQTGAA